MSLGILMLVHTALDRAEQVARHWARAGCPVVIHVDSNVAQATHDAFVTALSDLPQVLFSRRHRCEWGTWGLVAASQDAADLMLAQFAGVRHVYLTSGSCLPLRPVAELIAHLEAAPRPISSKAPPPPMCHGRWGGWIMNGSRCSSRFHGGGIVRSLTASCACSGGCASAARCRPA